MLYGLTLQNKSLNDSRLHQLTECLDVADDQYHGSHAVVDHVTLVKVTLSEEIGVKQEKLLFLVAVSGGSKVFWGRGGGVE
jgi:hypothetical protein